MRPTKPEHRIPDDTLGELIRQAPYTAPDPQLTRRIMSQLEPKPLNWFRRLVLRLRTPMTITVSPLAAATAVLMVFIIGGVVYQQVAGKRSLAPGSVVNGQGVPVALHFKAPSARSVAVMGTFNNWDPQGYEMTKDQATGTWSIQLRLKPGKHDYVFWVNGEKAAVDPYADVIKEDGFGNTNSVLFVKGNNGQAI